MTLDLAALLRGADLRLHQIRPDGSLTPAQLSGADLARPITGVAVDSRLVSPGSLFVALRGEQTDGHLFLDAAFRAGALAALVSYLPESMAMTDQEGPRYLLQAADALTALQDIARRWRTEHQVEVVGITGSIGKTTAKEITAAVLSASYPVLKSEANLNTEIGLPLTLLNLRPEHRVAVLEMGMYGPGDIALLADIARPRLGMVTNVEAIHLERVGTIEAVARAKSELVAGLPAGGLAILNGDDPWTRAMAISSGIAPSVLAGFGDECDYRAEDVVDLGLDGESWTLVAEGQRVPMASRVPGRHTIRAFLMAVAAAREIGLPWKDIQQGVEAAQLDVRQRLIRGIRDILIIDDSYNAAPMSMNAALALLATAPGTKIAVLGDMLELGPIEEEAHRDLGPYAAEVADWLVTRGSRAAWIAEAAQQQGMPSGRVVRVSDNEQAAAAVRAILASQASAECSVLVKGSRGMRMEEVVNLLQGTE